MKIKDIDLVNISRFRGEHMGMAMFFIILFHVFLPRTDDFFGLRRMGNLGVDMFLFLSGVGLWFSWAKVKIESFSDFRKAYISFYKRRLSRIYPAWIIIACLFYIPHDLFPDVGDVSPVTKFYASLFTNSYSLPTLDGVIEALGDILINWDFWLNDEGTFWYIPATMMLYLFAPPYMELIRRHPIYHWLVIVMVMWCVLVQYVTPIHHAVGHIEIFWSRVPIFFLGINMGEAVRKKQSLDGQSIWMIWIMFGMTLSTSIWLEQEMHGRFPLFLERMLYIPLTVTTIILLNRVFRRTPSWVNKPIAWVGSISLEAYLIHIEFVLKPIETYHLGYWPTFLLTVAITLPLAYVLHRAINGPLPASPRGGNKATKG